MARFGPVLPIVGAETKVQPVSVDDVAEAAVLGITGIAKPGIYALAGPDQDTFRGLMYRMLKVIQRRRLVLDVPMFIARLMATSFEMGNKLTFGIAPVPMTRDQVKSLSVDNVPSGEFPGFDELGIEPVSMVSVLPEYLWPFRVFGQFAEIKSCAKILKS